MHAMELIEQLAEFTPDAAARWVAAALAEASALRAHDASLFPAVDEAVQMRTAQRLHEAWQRWSDDADAVLRRLSRMLPKSEIDGARDLQHAVGRARAMLQITPRDHLRGLEHLRCGEVRPSQEVRRELRSRAG